jgi:hypothetical protein
MSYTVQNDAGTVVDANVYQTLDEFKAYCADRAMDVSNYDDAAMQAANIIATAYIDNDAWKGELLTDEQTTQFPRACLYDRAGRQVQGIFRQLKQANSEYAYQALLNGGRLELTPQFGANGLIAVAETKKLGPIEKTTSYMAGGQYTRKPYPTADKLLAEFRKSTGQRVIR